MGKGWITAEDVVKFREIKETVSAEKAASPNENMINNIAKGRVGKSSEGELPRGSRSSSSATATRKLLPTT